MADSGLPVKLTVQRSAAFDQYDIVVTVGAGPRARPHSIGGHMKSKVRWGMECLFCRKPIAPSATG